MQVNGALSYGTASGQAHFALFETREQGTKREYGGAHFADYVIKGFGAFERGGVYAGVVVLKFILCA